MDQLSMLQQMIEESHYIVFFGGAGVSTESGIPDFRSTDGLYHQQYPYPPEVMLSYSFFQAHPVEFFRFYKEKLLTPQALPNPAHKKLAELEKCGKLKAIITQNIDGLHQQAGSKTVIELHGSVHRNYCTSCHKSYPMETILHSNGIPRCECGGIIKPDVVLYEEPLDEQNITQAIYHLRRADLLIIGGTSLVVYPAAGLIQYYRGKNLVLINKSITQQDQHATLLLHGSIGEILNKITC